MVNAQFQMPDPKQMSGIPRPVGPDELPNGSVSVRLIKGELSNNIANFPVELHVGDKVQTAKTDDAGRVQFDHLPAGTTLKAVAVVDGERLESQEFPAPAQGGIRLMLVATDKDKTAKTAAEASAPAIQGQIAFGDQSRIVMEPGDEIVELYYILTVTNSAHSPVNPPTPFAFDMPAEAQGTTILEGSSPSAKVTGRHVLVAGPFPPGETLVQVACTLPVKDGNVDVEQKFPVALPQLTIIAKKVDDMHLVSAQIDRQQEMPANGDTYVAAAGVGIAAGQTLSFTVSGLAHHSTAPRWAALSATAAIVLLGVWASATPKDGPRGTERKQLIDRREKLFQELVRLENDRQKRGEPARSASRREELLLALESVYGSLDTGDGLQTVEAPGPAR